MMLDRLRSPFLVLAILLCLALVLAEAGLTQYQEPLAALFARLRPPPTGSTDQAAQELLGFFPQEQQGPLKQLLDARSDTEASLQGSPSLRTFGYGLRYLWLVDGLLLFSLLLIGLGVILPPAWQARIQGPLTLLYALFVISTAIVLIMTALAVTILMITLLLAFPFGTIAYMIAWGYFNRGGAAAVLAAFFTIKLIVAGAVALAHQRFLQNLGLVLIIIMTLVANLIVSFLHGLVPGFLVSISDAIAGIVVGIVGVILAVIMLISAVLSTIAAFRL